MVIVLSFLKSNLAESESSTGFKGMNIEQLNETERHLGVICQLKLGRLVFIAGKIVQKLRVEHFNILVVIYNYIRSCAFNQSASVLKASAESRQCTQAPMGIFKTGKFVFAYIVGNILSGIAS